MQDKTYVQIATILKRRPKQLTTLDQWLFVAVNTAKSMIDNTSKGNIDLVLMLACRRVANQHQRQAALLFQLFLTYKCHTERTLSWILN